MELTVDHRCRIGRCRPDPRRELETSTPLAVAYIAETWSLDEVQFAPVPLKAALARHTDVEPEAVVAVHLLAACWYARHHAETFAFTDWAQHLEPGAYCEGVRGAAPR